MTSSSHLLKVLLAFFLSATGVVSFSIGHVPRTTSFPLQASVTAANENNNMKENGRKRQWVSRQLARVFPINNNNNNDKNDDHTKFSTYDMYEFFHTQGELSRVARELHQETQAALQQREFLAVTTLEDVEAFSARQMELIASLNDLSGVTASTSSSSTNSMEEDLDSFFEQQQTLSSVVEELSLETDTVCQQRALVNDPDDLQAFIAQQKQLIEQVNLSVPEVGGVASAQQQQVKKSTAAKPSEVEKVLPSQIVFLAATAAIIGEILAVQTQF